MSISRLIGAEIEYMLSLFRGIESTCGGIETATFGAAVAFQMQGSDEPTLNRVLGFDEASLPRLNEVIDFYHRRGSPCRFDVVSAPPNKRVDAALTEHGFRAQAVETFLCCEPHPACIATADAEVRALGPDEIDEFATAFLSVYQCEPSAESSTRACLKAQYGQPGWHCYLALLDGKVAAFGAMRVNGGVASLISSATVPDLRRLGCQTALLARRVHDAADLGCDLVFSHAACGSTSERNMKRLGMRAVATKSRWEQPAS